MKKLNKDQIRNLLPHREPMLLIDELKDIEKLTSATAVVNVRKNSFFVQGHFPNQPVMPGVLIVESFGNKISKWSDLTLFYQYFSLISGYFSTGHLSGNLYFTFRAGILWLKIHFCFDNFDIGFWAYCHYTWLNLEFLSVCRRLPWWKFKSYAITL